MLLGCVILALGIWIQLKGSVAMLPGEAMNRAISKVFSLRYENVKIFFDILYISIAAVICLIFLGKLKGVREGSIIAAILVGNIIKVYNHVFNKIAIRQSSRKCNTLSSVDVMKVHNTTTRPSWASFFFTEKADNRTCRL